MLPEERELLKKSVSLAEENNKMLHLMRRSQRVSQFMSLLYWVLIIGSAVGAYVLIQPYVDQVVETYGSFSSMIKNFAR